MSPVLALAVTVGLLAVLVQIARSSPHRVLAVLVSVQCTYWAIAYLGRGITLLAVQPRPRLNDSIADARLFVDNYGDTLAQVLWLVDAGLAFYITTLFLLRSRVNRVSMSERICPVAIAALVYLVGWGCRIAQLGEFAAGPVVSSLALFGPLGAGLLLVKCSDIRTKVDFGLAFLALFVAETLYAALIGSKTPVMAVLLFAALGLAMRGWKIGTLLAIFGAAAFVVLFAALQSLKTVDRVSGALARVDSYYPLVARPFLPLMRRFDLLSAATDAVVKPEASWLGWDYLLRLLHGLVPFLTPAEWVPYETAGLSWTAEVRSYSLPQAGQSVSLAEGFAAEGYAWLGWIGVILLACATAVLTVTLSRLVGSEKPFLFSAALLMLSQPTIFERGLQGAAEAAGQSVQAAFAFTAVWWLLGGGVAGASSGGPQRAGRYISAIGRKQAVRQDLTVASDLEVRGYACPATAQ
jgi:hypothetical protein